MSFQMKHLSLVESTASDAFSTVERTYGAAKGKALSLTPGFVSNMVTSLESFCTPFVSFGQKSAFSVLLYADSTVDTGVNLVASTAQFSRKTAGRIVGDERLKPVDNFVTQAHGAVSAGFKTYQERGIVGAVKAGVAQARTGAEQATTYARCTLLEANQTVGNGAAAVKERIKTVQTSLYNSFVGPAGKLVQDKYMAFHGTLVKQPQYASVFATATDACVYISASPLVKSSISFYLNRLYPSLQPVAKPLVDTCMPYIATLEKHVQPQADAVPMQSVVLSKDTKTKAAAKKAAKAAAPAEIPMSNGATIAAQ